MSSLNIFNFFFNNCWRLLDKDFNQFTFWIILIYPMTKIMNICGHVGIRDYLIFIFI